MKGSEIPMRGLVVQARSQAHNLCDTSTVVSVCLSIYIMLSNLFLDFFSVNYILFRPSYFWLHILRHFSAMSLSLSDSEYIMFLCPPIISQCLPVDWRLCAHLTSIVFFPDYVDVTWVVIYKIHQGLRCI